MDTNRLPAGSYNRVVGVQGPKDSGKTTLAIQLLQCSPGYQIAVAARLPKKLPDGTPIRATECKAVKDIRSCLAWHSGNVVVVTAIGDKVIDETIAECRAIVASSIPRDKSSYIPCTILIDEATRWQSALAGKMSASCMEFMGNSRHWGIGLIYCTQLARVIDEKVFALSTEIYSFLTRNQYDIQRLRASGEFTDEELRALGELPRFSYVRKAIGEYGE